MGAKKTEDNGGLLGQSGVFAQLLEMVRRLAAFDGTVLVVGETGTGKELVARAIHYLGPRRNLPFLPVNCGAIPDTLVESELFGHTRGAFTDARDSRAGVIAQAEGGTLFLDEIETLSVRGQVALLRFLQDHEYRPLGAHASHEANVRVLAASNVDLEALAERGGFRHDLLYRLEVFKLEVPALRSRGDDVTLLAESFVARFCREYHKPPQTLAPDAVAYLRQHAWPGNVRQLENLIRRAVFLCDDAVLGLSHITFPASDTAPVPRNASFREAKARAIASFERSYLSDLLAHTRGNITMAARLSGKERSRLTKLVKKHGLDRSRYSLNTPDRSTV